MFSALGICQEATKRQSKTTVKARCVRDPVDLPRAYNQSGTRRIRVVGLTAPPIARMVVATSKQGHDLPVTASHAVNTKAAANAPSAAYESDTSEKWRLHKPKE